MTNEDRVRQILLGDLAPLLITERRDEEETPLYETSDGHCFYDYDLAIDCEREWLAAPCLEG